MADRVGVPDSIPTRYVGPNANIIPIKRFPRIPLGTDKNFPVGQVALIGKNPSTGNSGDLWYLAEFTSGLADWRILSASGGSVTELRDQVDTLVSPTNDGYIDTDGSTVANAANPSGIPFETVGSTNTMTFQIQVGAAITGAPADKNDAGLVSANDTQFTFDANGYLSLVGGTDLPGIQTLTSDDPTIVGPDASGNVDLTGETVANATNAKPVFVDAGTNALNVEVQVGAAITGAPADMNDAGTISADDTVFTIDANGWLSLATTGVATTITGDSGGALSPIANNWNILGGAGVTTTGSGATLTIDFSGSEIPTPGVRNLGIKLSAGTFSIVSADGTDLTSSNKGFVTLPSVATPGEIITISVEDNHQFIDDAGVSTVAGMLWGTTVDLDWADDIPFFIYAIMNDDDDEVAFGITRSPAMSASYATANIGISGATVTTTENSLFLLDLETGPTTPTVAEYDTNPALLVGSFRMTKTSTTSNDWTVSTLADTDGIGRYQLETRWTLPTGQNGSVSGKYYQNTTGTEPTYSGSSHASYYIYPNGIVKFVHEMNNADAGASGAGALEPTLPVTSLSGADAYTNCRLSDSGGVRTVYTGTININSQKCVGLYKANTSTALTNGTVASGDEFTFHAIYPGFN